MPVFLSPGVFTREIDLSAIPAGQGGIRPAFIGAAKKGPMNTPTFVANGQQYVDLFGEPFPTSYLGYDVLEFFKEGDSAWILRVGLEYRTGLPDSIVDDAIDVSGAKNQGWGRIPVYQGIDYGTINFREISSTSPAILHNASHDAAIFTDADASGTGAELTVTGTYTGCLDDVITLLFTGGAVGTGDALDKATFEITNSAGDVLDTGAMSEVSGGDPDTSKTITVTDIGLTLQVDVDAGAITAGDVFTFGVHPNNRVMQVKVNDVTEPVTVATGTYSTATTLVAAINAALISTSVDYESVVIDSLPSIRTLTAGDWIQLYGTCAFATEMGVSQYVYDIPRSFLIGVNTGPYVITSSNNRVVMDVIDTETTKRLDFTIAAGGSYDADTIVSLLNSNATVSSTSYFIAYKITVPGGTDHVVMMTTTDNKVAQLKMLVTFTFLATLRFAEVIGFAFPYTRGYRSFFDSRRVLPTVGNDGVTPASCVLDPLSSDCTLDTAYYQNVIGWFVAKYAGTWADDFQIRLDVFTEGLGNVSGRYKVTVLDASGVAIDQVQDVTFDSTDTRYIGNVVNEGSPIGGANGNSYYQWVMRPDYLVDASDVRVPSTFTRSFVGGANGIPSDAAYSDELDSAVIGSQALSTGIYALDNPEEFDFNLLSIPGFVSGSVLATALQFCESRGDVLFIVDPPFGLRTQQVVDWHNGLLTSDLATSLNSSYGALYWSWVEINDVFNGGTIWIPPSGPQAARFAFTAREAELWFAPAGTNRGRMTGINRVEFNPVKGERDLLYGSGNAINPIVKFIKDGIVTFGQRTLQRRATALDRVNVRMLLIFLKTNLNALLRGFIFEQNDAVTRIRVKTIIDGFLSDILARRGLTAFLSVVDETNNTPERIARHELWVSVFLQPTAVIEFIALNLVTLNTGQSFTAQEVLAAGGVVASV